MRSLSLVFAVILIGCVPGGEPPALEDTSKVTTDVAQDSVTPIDTPRIADAQLPDIEETFIRTDSAAPDHGPDTGLEDVETHEDSELDTSDADEGIETDLESEVSTPDTMSPPDVPAVPDAVKDTTPVADTSPPEYEGPCCEVHLGVGCEESACVAQVCNADSYCCDTQWDSVCVKCAKGDKVLWSGACEGMETTCGCEPQPPTYFEIAAHWAPVWYHDTDSDDYEADYIVAVDFDGDEVSDNNWDNLKEPVADLSAVIYYSVVETETHYFILYADFHPRDWDKICNVPFKEPCHENDMEGAMVVVRKTAEPFGAFELLYTEAHNSLHIFHNNPEIVALSNPDVEEVGVTFENGSHVELYVESKGHGVCALYYNGSKHCKHDVSQTPPEFGGGDGVVYRYKGIAETPTSGSDDDVGYKLVPLEAALWAKREDICDSGCLFDTTFDYQGVTLPKAFDGDSYGKDKANPPWAWDAPDDGPVYRGDFFFRPAESMKKHVFVPGLVSTEYIYNPFLDDV